MNYEKNSMYNVHDTPLGLLSGIGEKNLQSLSFAM